MRTPSAMPCMAHLSNSPWWWSRCCPCPMPHFQRGNPSRNGWLSAGGVRNARFMARFMDDVIHFILKWMIKMGVSRDEIYEEEPLVIKLSLGPLDLMNVHEISWLTYGFGGVQSQLASSFKRAKFGVPPWLWKLPHVYPYLSIYIYIRICIHTRHPIE